MACNDLWAENVITSGQSSRNGERVFASVGDEVVNSPFSTGVSLLSKLDPYVSSTVGCGWGYVDHDWSLVRRVDDIISSGIAIVEPLNSDLIIMLDYLCD